MWHETTPTIVEIPQAQYDLLSEAEKNNGVIYLIPDSKIIMCNGVIYGKGGGLVHTRLEITTSEYTVES